MDQGRKIRILIAKAGLDGHDRGAKVIARAFQHAGYEVIYTGLHQTPEEIVQTAIQEDVDLIGLSSLAGAHMYHFTKIIALLRKKSVDDVLVCGGGIFPKEDIVQLKERGVHQIFTPGTPLADIVQWVAENVVPKDNHLDPNEAQAV